MTRLTEYTSYADAQKFFSSEKLWELFDGDRQRLNIAHECVDRYAASKQTAVIVVRADGPDELISYQELSQRSSQVAHFLQARGVEPGDRVAVMLEPSLAFYASIFGIIKAGAIAVPLFTLFGPDGLRLRLQDCSPALLITNAEKMEIVDPSMRERSLLADASFMSHLDDYSGSFETNTLAEDYAIFQYTSGTTRELPEAVRHKHRSIVTLMVAALYGTGLRPGDRYMCPSSPAWGHGLWHGTLAPMALGLTVGAFAGKFDAKTLLLGLQEHQFTNISAAATHYRMMKNSGVAQEYQYTLRKMSFTGEPIDSATEDFIEQTFGLPVCSMYGTTEIGVILVSYPGAEDFTVKRGSLGKAIPGAQVQVQDSTGNPCPPGVSGDLMVWRKGQWLATKDLARVDADGYFFHGGRADDVIISAGWTMSAVEIEDAILKHPDVKEAAAIGVPDTLRGQAVKAYVVSSRRGDDLFRKEIQDLVRTGLSQHEYPRHIEFLAELPKTPAGKVHRKKLREAHAAHHATTSTP
jgi:acetyl-CoA synthetase